MLQNCKTTVETRKSEPRDIKWKKAQNKTKTEIATVQYGKDSKGRKWKRTTSDTNEMLFIEKNGQWCVCADFDEEPSQNDIWCRLSRQNKKV